MRLLLEGEDLPKLIKTMFNESVNSQFSELKTGKTIEIENATTDRLNKKLSLAPVK